MAAQSTSIATDGARGANSSFRIPLADTLDDTEADQTAPETPPAIAAPGKPPQRRVLVVDDNSDSATTLGKMLEMMGSEVRLAHDGLQAVDVASSFQPEIIFMDLGMPNLNGYDATRRIRTMPWGRSIDDRALTRSGAAGRRPAIDRGRLHDARRQADRFRRAREANVGRDAGGRCLNMRGQPNASRSMARLLGTAVSGSSLPSNSSEM